ncbi:MAG: methylated-DNA--[protein]-cysteine S-methyltransferase [Eubacteriales bacterium]
MIYISHFSSPIGTITLASDAGGESLVGLWLQGQKYFFDTMKNQQATESENRILLRAEKWLEDYFSGKRPPVSELKLSPHGSEFRRTVWDILLEIPYGEVRTYGDIAKDAASRLGVKRMSAQAVGGAVGHNPISIIIPCHRVVGSDGSLTGYAGGVDKKLWLLRHEGYIQK